MTRVGSGLLGVGVRGLTIASALLALAGCAPKPADLDDGAPRERAAVESTEEVNTASVADVPAADADVLLIRELKIIDDNGQQGVFAKLNRAPDDVSHVVLSNPNRLLIELSGPTGENIIAERYAVDNPLIEQVQLGSDPGKIRLTLLLKGTTAPTVSVDDLKDTIVAFVGEPAGTQDAVRESIVFTQRAVPGIAPAPAPVAMPVAPPPAAVAPAARLAEAPPPSPPPAVQVTTESSHVRPKKLYYGQPISLDLKDADVHNVLRLLADVSGLNIVATDDVTGTITLRLNDIPWDQALDIILQAQNLESVHEGNVLRVSTVKRLREEREEQQASARAAQKIESLQVAYIQVNYAKARKLAELISGADRPQAAGSSGGRGFGGRSDIDEEFGVLSRRGSVMVDEFTNTLIVRDIDRGIRNARDLVKRLDVQIPQVLIESNIVEATSDFSRQLGVQWGYNANIGPQTGTSTGSNFPGTVNFGGSGLGSGSGGVPFLVDFPAKGNFGPGAGSVLDLALGSLNGAQSLDVRLTALEQKGQGRIISRPRVVTLNNVAATIQSLTILRVRLPSTGTVINTGAGGAAGTAQTATEKIETGITLEVTPQVSSDGFVLLDMFAKSSQADFTRTVDNIPTEITRQATSHVLVRDGQTVVLGGIYRDTQVDNMNGVPWFNSIPGLGWLFKSEGKDKRREDLLVFLTPRVLKGATGQLGGNLPSAQQLWENRDSGPNG
ncbi:MAG: type IV pilus secretin PilQ [Deltaproteobacteria bacterium]|nr:type IV pilus secretin PilQ [Deltaproteobacteria bacterium]